MTERAELPPEAEIASIVARLRNEIELLQAERPSGADYAGRTLRWRGEAQRLWAVTAERPYLSRSGRAGRLRGAALKPIKAVLRRLMRWYVEPVATDQRAFNAVALQLVDELADRVRELERRVAELER
jgi:hypothetical protein